MRRTPHAICGALLMSWACSSATIRPERRPGHAGLDSPRSHLGARSTAAITIVAVAAVAANGALATVIALFLLGAVTLNLPLVVVQYDQHGK
jgi:hypothetical protein